MSSDEPFGFAWIVISGFLRIVTNGRIMPTPLTPESAIELVDDWLQQPPSLTIVPTHQHWPIYKELLMSLGTAANLTSDADIAALAIEHGVRLYSTDNVVAINRCGGRIQSNKIFPAVVPSVVTPCKANL